MTSPLARMHVQYDDGYFDKDEQGWCSNNVGIRVADGIVHVDQWGDANGQRPYAYAWEGRIAEVDEANEVILITRGNDTVVFDLRSQRILGYGTQMEEKALLLTPLTIETLSHFAAHAQRLFGDDETKPAQLELSHRGEHINGVDMRSPTHPWVLRWRSTEPLVATLSGHIPSHELRALRRRVRAWQAPLLVRPSLAARTLVREGREVGSMLSWLDHGGGADAQTRIALAGANARALLPFIVDAQIAKLAAAFAQNPTSSWVSLVELAHTELAMRPTHAWEAYADACAVMQMSDNDAAVAMASAALEGLPADLPTSIREAFIAVQQAQFSSKEAQLAARQALIPPSQK